MGTSIRLALLLVAVVPQLSHAQERRLALDLECVNERLETIHHAIGPEGLLPRLELGKKAASSAARSTRERADQLARLRGREVLVDRRELTEYLRFRSSNFQSLADLLTRVHAELSGLSILLAYMVEQCRIELSNDIQACPR